MTMIPIVEYYLLQLYEVIIIDESIFILKYVGILLKENILKIVYIYVCVCMCVCVKMKVAQPCLTLCDPMDCIVHVILQARILEWVAFPFSRGSSQSRNRTQISRIASRILFLPAELQGKTSTQVVHCMFQVLF